MDEYEYCQECRGYGNNYCYDPEIGEDVYWCDECFMNPDREEEW